MGNEVIDVLGDDGDEDFLSMLDAVEAQALAASRSKRQKLSPARVASNSNPEIVEGPYMAALRGSRSALWQQQQQQRHQGSRPRQNLSSASSVSIPAGGGGGGGGGGCFKCGESGHWSRDCTAAVPGRGQGGFGAGAEDGVPEKACPCGSGSCLVLTSNTTKNPGRKFYRCPLRPENGGCGFFEWCDDPSPGLSASRAMPNHNSSSSFPDLQCPCGAGSCLVLVTKTGKNVGQQYYRCPANEGRCGFFKWCSEHTSVSNKPTFTSQYNSSDQFSGEKNSSSCFKCGQGGHWARDCTNSSEHVSAPNRPTYTSQYNQSSQSSGDRNSSSCFKCGQGGHWARDCTNSSEHISTSNRPTTYTSQYNPSSQSSGDRNGSSCFKCGQGGHWARDCPDPQVGTTGGGGGRKTSKSSRTPFNY